MIKYLYNQQPKYRIRYLIISLLALFITTDFLQANTRRLRHIPLTKHYRAGDINFSLATGINTNYTYQTDLSLDYTFTKRFKAGINIIGFQTATYDLSSTLFESNKANRFRLQTGILNISRHTDFSFNHSKQLDHLMLYLTASHTIWGGRFHYGITKRNLNITPSLQHQLLLGYQKTIKNLSFILDFDGTAITVSIQPKKLFKSLLVTASYSNPQLSIYQQGISPLINLEFTSTIHIYNYLSHREVILLATHPWYFYSTYKASYYALKYTKDYFGHRQDSTLANAFQHSLLNAYLADYTSKSWVHLFWEKKSKGLWWAKAIMDAHEMKGNNWDSQPGQMDLHNNHIGRHIFNENAQEISRYITVGFWRFKKRIKLGTKVISHRNKLRDSLKSMTDTPNQHIFINAYQSEYFTNKRFTDKATQMAEGKLLHIQTQGGEHGSIPGYSIESWY